MGWAAQGERASTVQRELYLGVLRGWHQGTTTGDDYSTCVPHAFAAQAKKKQKAASGVGAAAGSGSGSDDSDVPGGAAPPQQHDLD